MVKSRFSVVAYAFIFFILLLLAVDVALIIKDGNVGRPGHDPEKERWRSAGVIFLSFVLIYVFARNVKRTLVSSSEIVLRSLLKRQVIDCSSIQSIDLFGRSENYSNAATGIRIKLRNGKDVVIFGTYYNNMYRLRQALSDHYKDKIKDYAAPPASNVRTAWHSEKFAGNFHSSFNAVLFYVMGAGFIALALIFKEAALVFTGAIMVPVMFFHAVIQSYHFEITGQDFMIRNHLLPWVNKKYALTNILIVEFERPHKRSNAAVLFTSDFRRKEYSAGSLRSKHWIALKEALQKAGIRVNNRFLF